MVGMDQVVCQECAEVFFIDVSMACGRLVLRFRPGEPVGAALKYSILWHSVPSVQERANLVVWGFAPQQTLLGPPRRLGWTKWYVMSVSKWVLFMFR